MAALSDLPDEILLKVLAEVIKHEPQIDRTPYNYYVQAESQSSKQSEHFCRMCLSLAIDKRLYALMLDAYFNTTYIATTIYESIKPVALGGGVSVYKPVPAVVFKGVQHCRVALFEGKVRKVKVRIEWTCIEAVIRMCRELISRCPKLVELCISLDNLKKPYAEKLQEELAEKMAAINVDRTTRVDLAFTGAPVWRVCYCGSCLEGATQHE